MHEADAALVAWYDDATAEPLPGGLINESYRVRRGGRIIGVFQALNTAIFAPEVHFDIDAVTRHLAERGVATPRLIPTRSHALWHTDARGRVWRLLTHEGDRTVHRFENPGQARSAGALVGRFHRAMLDFSGTFASVRPGAHDTTRHMRLLAEARRRHPEHRLAEAVSPVAAEIADRWSTWEGPSPADLPRRVIHGDLKVSNLRFIGDDALCLVDLDTLAWGTIDAELGDALRSWCNPDAEDVAEATFHLDILRAAMEGYASTGLLSEPEWASVVPGTERICLELAARFAADALNESYFGFDPRFGTRGDHNLLRARGQLALARSVRDRRPDAEALLREVRRTSP